MPFACKNGRCELYRAFGLGKGGFLELFGPHVWWRGAMALFNGCGIGHLAGDGLQMPGAFFSDTAKSFPHSARNLPPICPIYRTYSEDCP